MFDLSILVGDESYRICYKCNNAGMLTPTDARLIVQIFSTNGGFKRQTFSAAFISGLMLFIKGGLKGWRPFGKTKNCRANLYTALPVAQESSSASDISIYPARSQHTSMFILHHAAGWEQ